TSIAERQTAERFAGLAPDRQASDSAIDQRCSKPAAVGELVDNRVGNSSDRTVDQDPVIRRQLLPAGLERSFNHVDSQLACTICQLGGAFQRDDAESNAVQDRARITGTSADDEGALAGLD